MRGMGGGIDLSGTEPAVRMPVERPTTVYLNDHEWLTVQTTPVHLDEWALGYLFGEGVIATPADVLRLAADEERGLVWVDVRTGFLPEEVRTRPAPSAPVRSGPPVQDQQLLQWMREMLAAAALYQESGGSHVAAAVRADTGERILREDIGRHNAVDKVIGACLRAGWPPEQVVLLVSGRISYEMCTRLARFGAGIAVSRTAATDQAYHLAMRLGIDLVGYARSPGSLVVYTTGQRILRRVKVWS